MRRLHFIRPPSKAFLVHSYHLIWGKLIKIVLIISITEHCNTYTYNGVIIFCIVCIRYAFPIKYFCVLPYFRLASLVLISSKFSLLQRQYNRGNLQKNCIIVRTSAFDALDSISKSINFVKCWIGVLFTHKCHFFSETNLCFRVFSYFLVWSQ